MKRRSLLSILGAGVAAGTVGACNAPDRLASPPENLDDRAVFPGMPKDCRVVLGGSDDKLLGRIAFSALRREMAFVLRTGGTLGPANYLAISPAMVRTVPWERGF